LYFKYRKDGEMKHPSGSEILELLLTLYAEQESVKITYELEEDK
jgi:hypothetical protein